MTFVFSARANMKASRYGYGARKGYCGIEIITPAVFMQLGKPETLEEVVQIGGRILETADPSVGISGAEVTILELQKKTMSDANGYYTFVSLPQGKWTFEVHATGYQNEQVSLDIPAQSDQNYDIQLSP